MNEYPPKDFIHPCQFRTKCDNHYRCEKITEKTGFEYKTDTITCAQCCFKDGSPNEDYILYYTLPFLWKLLDALVLGFYTEDETISVLEKCCDVINESNTDATPYAKSNVENTRKKFLMTLDILHKRGLVDQDKLEVIVQTKMPELVPQDPTQKTSDCAMCDKSFGIMGYVSAKLSGEASKASQDNRMSICKSCTAVDSKGERLFREIDGVSYCGLPRIKKIFRHEVQDGCGCDLNDKTKYKKSKCPKSNWGYSE